MNEKETLFKVLELIILEPLFQNVLKFESSAAYAYFMKCPDTRKAYQALQVFVIGTALEMIQIYLNNSTHRIVSINLSTSVQLWLGNYCSKKLVTEIIIIKFTLPEDIVSWKCFMGFNRPAYQDIDYRDLLNKACYPKEIYNHEYKG